MKSTPHKSAIDLGVAISGCHCIFGVPVTCAWIAAYCNWNPVKHRPETVSRQAIERVEKIALRKCRAYLYRHPEISEELKSFFYR